MRVGIGAILAGALAASAAVPVTAGYLRPGLPERAPEMVQLAQRAAELPGPMRRALITEIQEELTAHGYDAGTPDGIAGRRTQAAIRAYQRDAGLRQTGAPTKDLLDHLKFAQPRVQAGGPTPPAPAERTARPAENLTLSVQRELQIRGYYTAALDGLAGPGTHAAIRAFQRDAGLPVTGDIDERLLAELRAVDSKITAEGRR